MSRCFLNYVEMHKTLRFAVYFWSKSPDPGSWIVILISLNGFLTARSYIRGKVFLSVWMACWQLRLLSGVMLKMIVTQYILCLIFSVVVLTLKERFCFFLNKGNQKSGSNYEKERRRILSHSVFFFSFCYRFLFLN